MIVPDVRLEPAYHTGYVDASRKSNALSELAVPIIVEGAPVAIINLESPVLNNYSLEDQKVLETLASHAASCIGRLRARERERLKEAEKQRDLLLGAEKIGRMVRHDLQAPLQAIKTYNRLIKDQPEAVAEYAAKIDESIDYAARIMENLRSIADPAPAHKSTIILREIISSCLDAYLIEKDIKVEADFSSERLRITGDSTQIRRVFDNLIKNAVEAMPNGGRLGVSLYKKNDAAVIRISDTGVGIPEEIQRDLFKPMITTKLSGTGLGLAICKQVVEAHGGEISFTSKVGEGTTFTVMLPLRR